MSRVFRLIFLSFIITLLTDDILKIFRLNIRGILKGEIMTNENKLYKCNICHNIVELIYDGGGQLVCCNEEMEEIIAKTEEEYKEKHLPVIEFEGEGKDRMVKIKVGEIEHPMTEEHFIRFIEAFSKDGVYLKRKILKPNDEPELHFLCNCNEMIVREYCNIHGLWSITI